MPVIFLRSTQYQSTGEVALLLEHDFGSMFANTTQESLRARMATPGDNWGDDETLAAAQAWVDADPRLAGKGYVVVLPPVPVVSERTAPVLAPPSESGSRVDEPS